MGMKPRTNAAAEVELLGQLREALGPRDDVIEKRMFGGMAFMVRGHMTVGVTPGGELMVRVGPDKYEEALAQPDARVMDFTGKPLKGFVYARARDQRAINAWVLRALEFVESMPAR